jgi:uncharacterized membrane protein
MARDRQRHTGVLRALLGGLFILAGLNHFWQPRMYTAMMPPYLPRHPELVALSGYAEIGLGALLVLPGYQRPARWGLIALLLAVSPVHLHMALNPQHYRAIPGWLLWARLPLQGALIALVYHVTEPNEQR